MSNLINVNGSDDPSYRYKMPRLVGKIEGRGNGIKTVIVNCSDIAQSLHRPSGQVTKFFGCELGAMSKYEDKIDRSLVNGAFETNDLQNILSKYIEKFVLCPSCGNPETVMEVKGKKKSATIWLSCKACGTTSEADNSHKLCTYILKEMSGPSKGLTKEERRKKKAERLAAEKNGEEPEGEKKEKKKKKKKSKKKDKDSDSDSDKERRRRRRKEKKRKERELAEAEKGENNDPKINPEDSEENNDTEIQPLVSEMESITVHDVAAIDSAVTSLQSSMAANLAKDKFVEEATKLQTNCGLSPKDRIPILFFAIMCDQPTATQMQNASALSSLADTKEAQIEMLVCLEETVVRCEESKKETALAVIPLILKMLYDEDVVDEEIIMQWFDNEIKIKHTRCAVSDEVRAQIKTNAQPIIDWLKEADTEEESEAE